MNAIVKVSIAAGSNSHTLTLEVGSSVSSIVITPDMSNPSNPDFTTLVVSIGKNWLGNTLVHLRVGGGGKDEILSITTSLDWDSFAIPYRLLFDGHYQQGTRTLASLLISIADVKIFQNGFTLMTDNLGPRIFYWNECNFLSRS